MKIAIVIASYDRSEADTKAFDIPYDPRPWLSEHHCEVFPIHKNEIDKLAPNLKSNFDLVINLCDGAKDEDRAGIEVIECLEQNQIPFTGGHSWFYEPSREEMKAACQQAGIKYPRAYTIKQIDDLQVNRLDFPLIVKHPNSYNSIGMTKESVVNDCAQLEKQVEQMIGRFGEAMVEQYIAGREFTVLLAGQKGNAIAYPPIEFLFPPGESFKHFNLKWKDFKEMKTRSVEDLTLAKRLMKMSIQHFEAMNGIGYARTDIRMNEQGELYLLEINPNCSVFYPTGSPGSADEILLKVENGHRKFLERIIEVALKFNSSRKEVES